MITIPATRGDMSVHVARPEGEGPWPGILVISDALGMTTDLRNQADWLAANGYLAAAPDLYYWGGRLKCLFTTMRQALAGEGEVFQDFEIVRAWLAGQPACTGTTGVIGFCMGGGFALMLAGRGGYGASSVNYGMLPKNALDVLANACPIVGSYGAKDPTLRKAPGELERILTAHGIDHDVRVYADAGHSFLNEHSPGEEPPWALVAGKLSHTEYHEPSAIHARRRILDFFGCHLR